MIRASFRAVLPVHPPLRVEIVSARASSAETIGVNAMGEPCPKPLEILQGADKTFTFEERSASTDFTQATEVSFTVWQGGLSGPELFSLTLTGGGVNAIGTSRISAKVEDTESTQVGQHYYEVSVVANNGDRSFLARGPFKIIDTRSFD